jgi:hypothetical protein
MKKLVALSFVMLFSTVAFAYDSGEVNLKMGLDFGSIAVNESWDTDYVDGQRAKTMGDEKQSLKLNTGISLSAEYLYPVIPDLIKVGMGISYLSARKATKGLDIRHYNFSSAYGRYQASLSHYDEVSFRWLPIYITIQANPLSEYKQVFVKTNIGYSAYFNAYLENTPKELKIEKNPGAYWGISSGFEFENGLIAEIGFDFLFSTARFIWDMDGIDNYQNGYRAGGSYQFGTYRRFFINAGYKFKI